MRAHHVLIVPGLNDHLQYSKYVWAAKVFWKRQGVVPHVVQMNWMNADKKFASRLKQLTGLIDGLSLGKNLVSLVGFSAGGSAVINAFSQRKRKIHRVVNSCGRMRAGKNVF